MSIFNYFIYDFWTLWSFCAQVLFLSSFIVQWYKSEKKKQSHLPEEFWYLRLCGATMLMVYFFKRMDLVLFVSMILQSSLYIRNLALIRKHRN